MIKKIVILCLKDDMDFVALPVALIARADEVIE